MGGLYLCLSYVYMQKTQNDVRHVCRVSVGPTKYNKINAGRIYFDIW